MTNEETTTTVMTPSHFSNSLSWISSNTMIPIIACFKVEKVCGFRKDEIIGEVGYGLRLKVTYPSTRVDLTADPLNGNLVSATVAFQETVSVGDEIDMPNGKTYKVVSLSNHQFYTDEYGKVVVYVFGRCQELSVSR